MILYTADLHFGHKNVILHDHRPFSSLEEMDATLIKLWNARVQPDDDVFIIGDFAYRNEKPEQWYLRRMRGRKHLLIGNHDGRLLKNPSAMSYFTSVESLQEIKDGEHRVVLCHFPMADWDGYQRGTLLVYGHIHDKRGEIYDYMRSRGTAYNAGCMINHYAPVSLRELKANNEAFWARGDDLCAPTVR